MTLVIPLERDLEEYNAKKTHSREAMSKDRGRKLVKSGGAQCAMVKWNVQLALE